MKTWRYGVCLLLLLLLPAFAFAQTQEEWELSCNFKTSRDATMYQYANCEGNLLGTLPANTYIKVKNSVDGWKGVAYMRNGTSGYGWIEADAIIRCSSQVRGSDGMAENVHELDPRHDEILESSSVVFVAPSVLADKGIDYAVLDFEGGTDSLAYQAAQKAPQQTSDKQRNWAEASEEENVQVTLEQLGTNTAKVSHQGKVREVPTSELAFSEKVPEDKRLAVVYAPRTGKATLRTRAASDASAIRKCKAGTIVSVLDYGRKFCKINDNGTVGYLLTSCLQFHAAGEQPEGSAQLTYKGRATGRTTINVRNDADCNSAKIAEWKTGTSVLVFDEGNGWYEIEANGKRGWVKNEFVTLTEGED